LGRDCQAKNTGRFSSASTQRNESSALGALLYTTAPLPVRIELTGWLPILRVARSMESASSRSITTFPWLPSRLSWLIA
jgi:hypothetical protein